MGRVTVEWLPHPVTDEGRAVEAVRIAAGATIADALGKSRVVDTELLPGCAVDVDGVPMELSDRTVLRNGAIVSIRPLAHGGSALPTLGQIALIGAIYFGPAAFGLTGIAAAFASAGIAVVGGLVLSALTSTPDVDTAGGPLPTIGAASNRARPYESLPLVMGVTRMWFDFATRPWTSFSGRRGRDENIHEIFHLGFGTLSVSDIRFGWNIASELGAETELVSRGQPELIEHSVVSEQPGGGELITTDWVERRTPADTVLVACEFEWLVYDTDSKGKPKENRIGMRIDLFLDGQVPISRSWLWTGSKPRRRRGTETFELPVAGSWLVRVRRNSSRDSEGGTEADVVHYLSLRSHRVDENKYAGENRLAVVRTTSAGVQGRTGSANALVGQVVPVWDADTESWGAPQVTPNPAAAMRAYARGFFVDGIRVAGMGLNPARIDDANLGAWFEFCKANDLTFGLAMQGGWTHDRFLRAVTAAGFATISWATGRLGVVIDRADVMPTALIHPGNVLLDTLEMTYVPPGPDEVVVRYEDAETRETESLRVARPDLGAATPETSVTVNVPGVKQRVHAGLIGARLAGEAQFHPRRIGWEMGREGRTLLRGRVAFAAASLLGEGVVTGRLRAIEGAAALVADRDLDGHDGDGLVVRAADGLVHQTTIVTAAGPRITIADPLPQAALGDVAADMIWAVYPTGSERRVRIVEQVPLSERRWRLRAQDEAAEFYAYAPIEPLPPPPRDLIVPKLSDVTWSFIEYSEVLAQVTGRIGWSLRFDLEGDVVIHQQEVYAGLIFPPPTTGVFSGNVRSQIVRFIGPRRSAPVIGIAVEYSVDGGERRWSDIAYADPVSRAREQPDQLWDVAPAVTAVGWVPTEYSQVAARQTGSLQWSRRLRRNDGAEISKVRLYVGSTLSPPLQGEYGPTDTWQRVHFTVPKESIPVVGVAFQYAVGGGDPVWTPIQTFPATRLTWQVDPPDPGGGAPVTAPSNLMVRVGPDGTRTWSWSGDGSLEHELRFAAAAVAWDEMDPLVSVQGLTAETKVPAGGTWYVEVRALGDGRSSTGFRLRVTLPELPANVVPIADFDEIRTEPRGKRTDDRPAASPAPGHTYYELRFVCPATEQDGNALVIYIDHVYRSWRWDGSAYQVATEEVTWRQAGGGWPGAVGVPARVLGAEVSGAVLTVRYDEALESGSVPGAAAWTVMVGDRARAVSAVALDGAQVRLTLSRGVTPENVVRVSYEPPAAMPLTDLEGIAAAPLVSLPVANVTPRPRLSGIVADGRRVTLTYDRTLDSSSIPPASAFTVTRDGSGYTPISVSIAGMEVRLRLSNAQRVRSGEAVTVTYKPPRRGPSTRDEAGSLALALITEAATNATS